MNQNNIIILLVISIIIYSLYNNKNNFNFTKSSFNNKIDFMVVSYETDKDDIHVDNLTRMLQKNNYNYKVLGNGEKWRSWYGRALAYEKYLDQLPPDTYVLLCDGRDVLINEDSNTFISKAISMRSKYGNKIIVGTEPTCCVGNLDSVYKASNIEENNIDFVINYMKQQEDNAKSKNVTNKFYYINFGLLFGTAKELSQLFKLINVRENLDDQALTHKIFYENPDLLFLDHNHELFSNASHFQGKEARVTDDTYNNNMCYFFWDNYNNKFKNTITNTYPSIIQTPGKNWDCYKMLAKKLINDPKFY